MKAYCEFCDHASLQGDELKCMAKACDKQGEAEEEVEIVAPYFINNVDIKTCSQEALEERIDFLKHNHNATTRGDLEVLATMILTGYPF